MTQTLQKHYINFFLLNRYWTGQGMNKMDYTEQNLANLKKLDYKINSISDKIEYYA